MNANRDAFRSEQLTTEEAVTLVARLGAAADTPLSTVPDTPSLETRVASADRLLREWGAAFRHGEEAADDLTHETGQAPLWGRYQLIRPLGEGSFGIVSLAYDTRLRRHVALKMPTLAQLGSRRHRQRLLHEARLAADLTHPGIVQVFEVGRRRSVAYIASAYCKGPTLAAWLRERVEPVSPRLAAEIVAQLAEAVNYAHGRGLLHRDLKPSNVLFEAPFSDDSAAPHVLLTDFGLASRIDESVKAVGEGVRGTLPYLSPEALSGEAPDVRSEVYSLGAILYELLTRTPPHGTHTIDDVEAARALHAQRVPRLRLRRPDVPRDLQAICEKCLAAATDERYHSAGELAIDLRRFRAGDPVQARPPRLPEATLRLCRRRPIAALLAASLAASVLIGLASVSWLYQRERATRQRAEVNRDTARRAVDDMYTQVAEKWLTGEPRMEGVRREFLLKALDFYQYDSRDRGYDEPSRFAVSVALHRAANVQAHFGNVAEAVRLRGECLALVEKLLQAAPENLEYRYARYHNLLVFSEEMSAQGDKSRGFELAFAAHDAARRLMIQQPDERLYRDAVAASGQVAGKHLMERERWQEAEATFQESLLLATELAREFPEHGAYLKHVAALHTHLGELYRSRDDLKASEAAYRSALVFTTRLIAMEPRVPVNRLMYVVAASDAAAVIAQRGNRDESAALHRQSLKAAERLVADFPENSQYRLHCGIVHEHLAQLLHDLGDDVGAREGVRAAIAHYDTLLVSAPAEVSARTHLVTLLEHGPIEALRDSGRARSLQSLLDSPIVTQPEQR